MYPKSKARNQRVEASPVSAYDTIYFILGEHILFVYPYVSKQLQLVSKDIVHFPQHKSKYELGPYLRENSKPRSRKRSKLLFHVANPTLYLETKFETKLQPTANEKTHV